jgi:enoyl-CoA hydratase/carnithine racemase
MSSELDVHTSGQTWIFTLNRPEKLNALNGTLVDSLLLAVEEAHRNGARLLVFRGNGKSFSAGFDLSEFESQSEGDLLLRFVRIELLLQAVAQSPAQTLALAHGKVFGAGVDLFAVCRRRVAAPDAVFRMPGLKFGLVLGTRRFGEIVGKRQARNILEEVGSFDAQRAREIGFAEQLAPREDWDGIVSTAQARAELLDDATRAELYRVLGTAQPDGDLSALVRSAARFGLKDRLRKYVGK